MKVIIMVTALLISMISIAKDKRYQWQYKTLTHELLKIEELTYPDTDAFHKQFDESYQAIDKLITSCKEDIGTEIPNDSIGVLQLLKTIDHNLVKHNFYICVQILRLSEGLILKPKGTYECTYCDFLQPLRGNYFDQTKLAYHIDCDLGSFLYISVAEAHNLPLKFVETKNHNFLRWVFNDGKYINWDVNVGSDFTDDSYRHGKIIGISSFDKEEEINNKYLINFQREEIFGYYYLVIGRKLKKDKNYSLAKQYYQAAIEKQELFYQKHCLAYMLIFSGAFNSIEEYRYANTLEEQASSYDLKDKEIAETLACSYALIGDFKAAIQTIDDANADQDLKNEFLKGNTGINLFRKKHPDYLN